MSWNAVGILSFENLNFTYLTAVPNRNKYITYYTKQYQEPKSSRKAHKARSLPHNSLGPMRVSCQSTLALTKRCMSLSDRFHAK